MVLRRYPSDAAELTSLGERKLLQRRELLLASLAVLGCAEDTGSPPRSPPAQVGTASRVTRSTRQGEAATVAQAASAELSARIPTGRSALAERWPELGLLPWRNIVSGATPLVQIPAESIGLDALWLKQDARCAPGYGGSKPRKLEALFGAALADAVGEVCTFGARGSNHVAATAVHGQRIGVAVRAYLLPAPLDDHGRRNLEICAAAGAQLINAASQRTAEAQARSWLGHRPRSAIFPWGGTSPTGNLGCVAAALELAAQFAARGLAPPDYVFVAGGTLGTAVGLELGLRAAQLPTRLVVMRASNHAPYTQRRFEQELAATREKLIQVAPELSRRLLGPPPRIDDSQLGGGYARPTPAARRARAWLLERGGFPLDLTYTGKAFAGLLARAPLLAGKRVVFWQTLDPEPMQGSEH
ncbi:MAG: pyridoxal-phosphate dependent enzyme [Polyangiaceae bacterium]